MSTENLFQYQDRTPSELRENARKAGIKSGEARRQKKTFREIAEILGTITLFDGDVLELEEIQRIGQIKGANLSVKEVMVWQQIQKAINGDTKAFEVVMGVLGEQPTDKVEIQVQQNKDSLDKLVAQMEE
ncbi:MAG: hypothetical protein IIZ78_03780 [Clostridiales bacterium]|nr:hypothetical protein [Clostridiales bacterium]